MLSFKSLLNPISKDVFFRFPFVFVFIIGGFLLAIFENHSIYFLEKQLQIKLFFCFEIMLIFSTSLYLFFEKRSKSLKNSLFSIFFTLLVFSFVIFGSLDSLVFLIFASIFSLVFASFLFKKSNNQAILKFNLLGIYSISFAFFSSFVLSLGIFAIVASLDFLFKLSFFKNNLDDIFIFIASVVFPILVLSNIPKEYEVFRKKLQLKSALHILIKNILSPLIFIYTLILYAYFFKIIILQELPKGELSWIISTYLCLGIFLKIFLSSSENEGFFTRKINKYFVYFMFLPMVFLFLAIYTRINMYGITEPRYALILLFIWFVYIFIFMLIKKEFCIKSSFFTLFLLLLFACFSPFNASKVSFDSQFFKLKELMSENSMLQNKMLLTNKQDLSLKTRVKISELTYYLTSSEYKKDKLNAFFNTDFKNQTEFLKYLNVKYASAYDIRQKNFYNLKFDVSNIAISSTGYDFVTNLNLTSSKKEFILNNSKFNAKIKENKLFINIKDEVFVFDLEKVLKESKNKKIDLFNNKNYEKLILKQAKNGIKIKIFIKNILNVKKGDKEKITYIEALFLMGKK